MKHNIFTITVVLLVSTLACSLGAPTGGDAPGGHPCGDGVCGPRENPQNCPQDCPPSDQTTTQPGGRTTQPAGERRGFILVHADPQEILNLHENYNPAAFDYDGDGAYASEDAWKALMDLVDLADSYNIPLTLQFSPPYIDFMRQQTCDQALDAGRVYPQGVGATYTRCLDLISAWEGNGHELSLHHHGPHHDPLKFDGYTNREVYSTEGKRPCYDDGGQTCSCPQGQCTWCAPPDSPLVCQEYTAETPPGLIGGDPEWKGRIEEGPDSMMALVYSVFGAGRIRSYCSNHGEEISDIPSDPSIIYTTQGSGYLNAGPTCIAYDVAREYHAETKYAWFYSHGPVFTRANLEDVKAALREALSSELGNVVGMVFHVNDFNKSETDAENPRYAHTVRDLFAYLSAPEDGGGPVRIEILSDLMLEAGKTTAPDPCLEICFTLDENSERASYTVPVPPPGNCP